MPQSFKDGRYTQNIIVFEKTLQLFYQRECPA
jgi:hypothetical protein